eukprot:CAMPEP_0185848584 /NCGR_PEP_ID=MMETSP1354-20130828/3406_1 /TAXON_ID=708628 /ORGANISM="Erythrolobus madagascarensis, Strain CCMP3276" /LENGTH=104 /DNA_ID=CAMNT_0028548995 /DNA_START=113 /DNA_END=428 /DNA_ORIENTATION=-
MAVNKEKNLVAFLLQVFPKYMQRDAFPNLWQRAAMAAASSGSASERVESAASGSPQPSLLLRKDLAETLEPARIPKSFNDGSWLSSSVTWSAFPSSLPNRFPYD